MIGDSIGREAARRVVPGGDTVDCAQDRARRDGRVGQGESADGNAVLDVAPEPRLVGVTPLQDGCPAVGTERPPLVDEHPRLVHIGSHDAHMCADQRRDGFGRVTGSARRRLGLRAIRGTLEATGRPIDDRPQNVLLGGDVGVQAGALDGKRPCDVADARRGVATLAEEVARDVLDGLATGELGGGQRSDSSA